MNQSNISNAVDACYRTIVEEAIKLLFEAIDENTKIYKEGHSPDNESKQILKYCGISIIPGPEYKKYITYNDILYDPQKDGDRVALAKAFRESDCVLDEADAIVFGRDTYVNGDAVTARFEKIAGIHEDCNVQVSVCDSCERIYPESWVIDNVCPFCGWKHTHTMGDE